MGVYYSLPQWLNPLVGYLLIMQIAFPWYGGTSDCPRLHFNSSHGCQPCSLCDPKEAEAKDLARKECRHDNPNVLDDGRALWCDDLSGPFPECPSIHQSLFQGPCSRSCFANFRSFAPGCLCTIGCPGQKLQTVLCREDLRWNSSDIPDSCFPSSSPAAPVTRVPVVPVDNDSVVLTIALGSSVIVILLVLVGVIMGTCFYKRLCARYLPQMPAPSAAPLLNGRAGSNTSSSEERIEIPPSAQQEGDQNGKKREGSSSDESAVIPVDCMESKQLPFTDVMNPRTQRESVQQREVDREDEEEEEGDSIRALKDLMNSRQVLVELSKRFDQKYAFDRITWHDVAVELLNWEHDDLHHMEYKYKGLSDSPGDGPMYKVLEDARQQDKGLLDLLHCLQQLSKKQGSDGRPTACQLLLDFWHNWKRKRAAERIC